MLQYINGVSSNFVEGRTKICQLFSFVYFIVCPFSPFRLVIALFVIYLLVIVLFVLFRLVIVLFVFFVFFCLVIVFFVLFLLVLELLLQRGIFCIFSIGFGTVAL
jgi:hypothetical protein